MPNNICVVPEVGHDLFDGVGILRRNVSPHCGEEDLGIAYDDRFVVDIVDIYVKFKLLKILMTLQMLIFQEKFVFVIIIFISSQ